jgi:hypothetical protein
MGWVSYLEDINERRLENLAARPTYVYRFERKPVVRAASPPLRPRMQSMVAAVPVRPDEEAIARRTRALNEMHMLSLLELRPGNRWRH